MRRGLVPRPVGAGARLLITRRTITRLLFTFLLVVPVELTVGAAAQGVARASSCGSGGGSAFGLPLLGSDWPSGFPGVPAFVGVPVYSNGPSSSYDNGCENSAKTPKGKTVPTGTEWQCVELVNRLYVTKGWIDTTWHGDGDTMWSQAPDGLQGVPQGSITYLAPGDVVSIEVQPPPIGGVRQPKELGGHVLIVSGVSGSNITFVSQNAGKNTPATVTTPGNLIGGTLTVASSGGWSYPVNGVVHAPVWLWDSLAVPPDEGSGAFLTYDIACPIKGTCVVVGSYTDAKGYTQGVIETLSGGKWKAVQAPLPVKTSGNPETRLFAVSCVSATYCVAVGGFADGSLIETLSGDPSTWKPKPYVIPEVPYWLGAVACGAVGACVAVSLVNTGRSAVMERLSNGTWKATSAPLPSEAAQAELDAVACPSSHSCVAVGYLVLKYVNDQVTTGLNETFSGGNWEPSLNSSVEVAGHAIQVGLTWTSIACASTSLCVAAGWESGNFGPNGSLANRNVLETLSDGHLIEDIPPLPAGATYPFGPSQYQAVACAPGGTCIAGLSYGGRESLIETWSAGRWRLTQAQVPSPNGAAAALAAACPTSTYCVLVGLTNGEEPLIDVWSQGHWATVEAEQPPGGGFPSSPYDYLEHVSCPTAGWCAALGINGMVEQTPGD